MLQQNDLFSFYALIVFPGVSYLVNGRPVVVGQIVEGRDIIHGHSYPEDHVCVLVLAAEKNTLAPFVINHNIEEQRLFVPGCYYAVPRRDIRQNIIRNGKLVLESLDD